MRKRIVLQCSDPAEVPFVKEAFETHGWTVQNGISKDSVLTSDTVVFACAQDRKANAAMEENLDLCLFRNIPALILHTAYLDEKYRPALEDGRLLDASVLSFEGLERLLKEDDPFAKKEEDPRVRRFMNRLAAGLAVLLALFAGIVLWHLSPRPDTEVTENTPEEEILRRYGDSVVQVWSVGAFDSQVFRGTGFFIRGDGYILTNAHVIEHPSARCLVVVHTSFIPAEIAAYSSEKDIALLHIGGSGYKSLELADSEPRKGETVCTAGFPQNSGKTALTGRYDGTRVTNDNGTEYAAAYLAVRQGCSGSPVLDGSGKVAGIVGAVSTADPSRSFMIPYDVCRKFLRDHLFVK